MIYDSTFQGAAEKIAKAIEKDAEAKVEAARIQAEAQVESARILAGHSGGVYITTSSGERS